MIINEVIEIIKEELDVNGREVNGDTKIIEDLGADSLDTIELLTIIQEKYNLELNENSMKKIKTVQDIVDYIEKNKDGYE